MATPTHHQAIRELADTAEPLRQAGHADSHLNPGRGEINLQLAGLVAACAQHYDQLSEGVADQSLRVADAVDHVTGRRRRTPPQD